MAPVLDSTGEACPVNTEAAVDSTAQRQVQGQGFCPAAHFVYPSPLTKGSRDELDKSVPSGASGLAGQVARYQPSSSHGGALSLW